MRTHVHETASNVVLQRVYGEFLEMPGLCLTYVQAQRLWGLDEATCVRILELLVERKFLCRTNRGMYARVTEGEMGRSRPQIVTTDTELIARKTKGAV